MLDSVGPGPSETCVCVFGGGYACIRVVCVCVYACQYTNVFFLKCLEAAVSCWFFQTQPLLSMTPAVFTWVPSRCISSSRRGPTPLCSERVCVCLQKHWF